MQVTLRPDIFVTFLHSVTVHISIFYLGFYNILLSDPFTLRQVLALHELWSFHNNEY